jgi:NhaA family Na+:H+ antiporter
VCSSDLVLLGLVVGKPLGIMLFSLLTVKAGIAELAEDISWSQLFGAALLSGIGFTMSIFISELSFQDAAMVDDAKIAIFLASIVAAVLGFVILQLVLPKARAN